MSGQPYAEPPKALRTARIVMFVQSLFSIVVGFALLSLLATSDVDDGDGLALILGGSLVLSVVLLGCAATLTRRWRGVWTTVVVIESLNAASALFGEISLLVAGGEPAPAGVLPIIVSMLVLRGLLQPEVRAWFARARAETGNRVATATPNEKVGE